MPHHHVYHVYSDSERNAYQEGHIAFQENRSEASNPYESITNEHTSWNDGWLNAQAEEED